MAWEITFEPYPDDQAVVLFTIFDEDRSRYQDMEIQVRNEIARNYEIEGSIGVGSIWWTLSGDAHLDPGSGWPWPVNSIPLRFHLSHPLPSTADIDFAVNERAIDAFEAVEPGVNRYLPIDCFDQNNSFIERRWLVNFCSRLDTIMPEHSPDIFVKEIEHTTTYWSDFTDNLRISISRRKVENRSFWIEYKWGGGRRLMSDRLWDELNRRNIHGWSIKKFQHILEF